MVVSQTDASGIVTALNGTAVPFWNLDTSGKVTRICNFPKVLSRSVQEQQRKFISEWLKVYPFEPTLVMEVLGIPSLIVRFDSIVNLVEGKEVHTVLELEDRPQAIGILKAMSVLLGTDFAQRLSC